MSATLTAVGAPESDNWREEMPIWAHMQWWELRNSSLPYRGNTLIGFVDRFDNGVIEWGYIINRSPNGTISHTMVQRRSRLYAH